MNEDDTNDVDHPDHSDEQASANNADVFEATPEAIAELRQKAAEYDALEDRLKRVTADYQNSQKRLERQAVDRVAFAIEDFARELLVVSDDLSRAIQATREHETVEGILEGLDLVEKHLFSVLERHGVTPVDTNKGDVFDPDIHEAVSLIETDAHEPNRVVETVQRGFRIHKRLLRPTRVIVSAEPKNQPDDRPATGE